MSDGSLCLGEHGKSSEFHNSGPVVILLWLWNGLIGSNAVWNTVILFKSVNNSFGRSIVFHIQTKCLFKKEQCCAFVDGSDELNQFATKFWLIIPWNSAILRTQNCSLLLVDWTVRRAIARSALASKKWEFILLNQPCCHDHFVHEPIGQWTGWLGKEAN